MDDPTTVHISSLKFPLLGAILGGMGYGVASTLFSICVFLLVKLGSGRLQVKSRDTCLLSFCAAVWICITVTYVIGIITLWNFLLDPEASPGYLNNPIGFPGLLVTIINNWMVDGLLVWRAVVILKNNGFPHVLLGAIPVILLLASVGIGCYMLITGSFTTGLVMAYLYTTIGLNISVTLIISVYLYIHQRRIIGVLGKDSSPTTKIISMLAESAALIVAFDLFFIIPFTQAQDPDNFSNLPLQLLAYVQAIGAFLIIFRVAKGKAWVTDDPETEVRRDSFAINSKVSEA